MAESAGENGNVRIKPKASYTVLFLMTIHKLIPYCNILTNILFYPNNLVP